MARRIHRKEKTGITVLIVDDNQEVLDSLKIIMEREGHIVLTTTNGHEAVEMVREGNVQVILLDYFMPEITGEEVVGKIREFNHEVQIILQTGYASEKPPREMLQRLAIQGYHDKSDGPEKILVWLDASINAYKYLTAINKGKRGLEYILNITPYMYKIQPINELVHGILLQIEGFIGGKDSFFIMFENTTKQEILDDNFDTDIILGTGIYKEHNHYHDFEEAVKTVINKALTQGQILVTENSTILPLIMNNKILGVIYLGNLKVEESDLNLLKIFCNQVSISLENALLNINMLEKDRLEREMMLAKRIQTAILPDNITNDQFEISGLMKPANEVGGDYYDFLKDKDGNDWFIIGDVSSHGLTPGLIMMMAQSMVKTLVELSEPVLDTKTLINNLNKILFDNIHNRLKVDRYMTAAVFKHLGAGRIMTSGLHTDIMIYRKETREVETIQTQGMWLGLLPSLDKFTKNDEFTLNQGDVMLIYSDGLCEAMDADLEMFEHERIKKILKEHGEDKLEEILDLLMLSVYAFLNVQADDITIVAIRKK